MAGGGTGTKWSSHGHFKKAEVLCDPPDINNSTAQLTKGERGKGRGKTCPLWVTGQHACLASSPSPPCAVLNMWAQLCEALALVPQALPFASTPASAVHQPSLPLAELPLLLTFPQSVDRCTDFVSSGAPTGDIMSLDGR